MMSRIATGAAAVSLTALAVVGMQAPASAQQACPTPGAGSGGQPGGGNGQGSALDQEGGVSDENAQRGQTMSANSGCAQFAPGRRVAFGVESVYQQLGTVVASVTGEATATFKVPTNLSNGQHHVVFRGTGFDLQPQEVRIPFQVSGGPSTVAPGTGAGPAQGAPGRGNGQGTVNVGGVALPRTGSEWLIPMTAAGLGLVGAGAGMVVVSRRRRSDLGVPA